MNQARIEELEAALSVAIEALDGFYGSDAEDSETFQHLVEVLNRG